MKFTLALLQHEHQPWAMHNFGDRPAWQPLMGMVEEIGEIDEATTEEEIADGFADTIIFMTDFCNRMNFDVDELFTKASYPLFAIDDDPIKKFPRYIGRIAHSFLKHEQNIRGTREQHCAEMKKQLTNLLAHMLAACEKRKWNLIDIVEMTWSKVKQRDFVAYPQTGLPR